MTSFAPLAALLGIGLGVSILYLVRRDHLHLRDGIFWIAVASVSLILGLWPGLIDTLAGWVGVAYPPALLLLVAIIVLMIRATLTDVALARQQRDIRRLTQRLAIHEADLAAKESDSQP